MRTACNFFTFHFELGERRRNRDRKAKEFLQLTLLVLFLKSRSHFNSSSCTASHLVILLPGRAMSELMLKSKPKSCSIQMLNVVVIGKLLFHQSHKMKREPGVPLTGDTARSGWSRTQTVAQVLQDPATTGSINAIYGFKPWVMASPWKTCSRFSLQVNQGDLREGGTPVPVSGAAARSSCCTLHLQRPWGREKTPHKFSAGECIRKASPSLTATIHTQSYG